MFTDVVVKQNPKKIEEIANNIKKEKNKEGSFGKRRSNFGKVFSDAKQKVLNVKKTVKNKQCY